MIPELTKQYLENKFENCTLSFRKYDDDDIQIIINMSNFGSLYIYYDKNEDTLLGVSGIASISLKTFSDISNDYSAYIRKHKIENLLKI